MFYNFKMLDGECFFGGTSENGIYAPFDKNTKLENDFRIESENQTMPMFISNKGRVIWSEEPFRVSFCNGNIEIEGEGVTIEALGTSLKEAYIAAQSKYFPVRGEELPWEFFSVPQYNTWMQHTYNPTEEKVLEYAADIIKNGFTPGIFIIDEGWQKEYGLWEFDPLKFPHPKETVAKLHEMGFTVMLWVTPSVRPDGFTFVSRWSSFMNPETYDKLFFRNENGKIVLTRWWNGYSATLDFTHEADCKLLDAQLEALMNDIGVDGFKFDGARLGHYTNNEAINGPVDTSKTPAERNIAWNEFGRRYRYHEFKDTFKGGGARGIQRTSDRNHSWDNNGLNTLIPNAILAGLLGHPFICPDMIGGGSWVHRDLKRPIDSELFVRMAQCSALFPMMQFSWAPWEAVDAESLALIKSAEELHVAFAPKIRSLVNDAYKTGEPIIRSLAYNYPDAGYEYVNDQFMLGENILVAPVVVKGETVKRVHLPEGKWRDGEGEVFEGGKTLEYPVTLASLPYFERV